MRVTIPGTHGTFETFAIASFYRPNEKKWTRTKGKLKVAFQKLKGIDY
jgi:hypothetical protein